MRQYPRSVKLENKPESAIIVYNEQEEIEAGKKGYESHWNPAINAKRKGTDREILREIPVKTDKKVATQPKIEEAQQDAKPVVLKQVKKKRKGSK